MSVVKNFKVKRRIPTWIWFLLFAVAMLAIVGYFTFPPWAGILNGLGTGLLTSTISLVTWLATMQFFIGLGVASLVCIVVFGRKYIFGERVKTLVAAQPQLQSQLSQGSVFSNTPTAKDLIIEEDK